MFLDVDIRKEDSVFEYESNLMNEFYQICLESEISWNNLMESSIESEFSACLKEDVELLNESIKETAMKVINWIRKKIKEFKEFMTKLMIKIKMKFAHDKKKRDSIEKPANGKVQVEIVLWGKNPGGNIKNITVNSLKELKNLLLNEFYFLTRTNADDYTKFNSKLDDVKNRFENNLSKVILDDTIKLRSVDFNEFNKIFNEVLDYMVDINKASAYLKKFIVQAIDTYENKLNENPEAVNRGLSTLRILSSLESNIVESSLSLMFKLDRSCNKVYDSCENKEDD